MLPSYLSKAISKLPMFLHCLMKRAIPGDCLQIPLLDSAVESVEPVLVDGADPLDEETLADNRVLQGDDQVPPEDPGEIVAHEEPVFDFPVVENDKVRYFIDYFSGRAKNTFTLWLQRSGRYLPMMQDIFARPVCPGISLTWRWSNPGSMTRPTAGRMPSAPGSS